MRAPLDERLSLIFANPEARAILETLYAIDAEIASIVRAGVDHGVAHAKLAWWRDEAERLATGRPVHPLARALHSRAGPTPRYRLLAERVDAAELSLVGVVPATEAELAQYLARSHGSLQVLAAEALAGAPHEALERFGRALGAGLGRLAALSMPGAPLIGTLPRAPPEAARALDDACAALPLTMRARQAHGLVRAALAAASLRRLASDAQPPSPIVKLLVAWRAARRAQAE